MAKIHRYTCQPAIELIKVFEGFKSDVYADCVGNKTIGYGHLIRKNEDFQNGITRKEGEQILKQDLYRAERSVLRFININLSDEQFGALVSFTFNLGGGSLQRSTLRMRLNRQENLVLVSNEFLRWCKAGGKVIRGLLRRRHAEKFMFLS